VGNVRKTNPRAVRLRIGGRVQGVGFRYFTVEVAESCGVNGFVRNLGDGAVEVTAEGTQEAIGAFLASLRQGPRGSRVEEFDVLEAEATGRYPGFEIRT
jgi:acylphosphatase